MSDVEALKRALTVWQLLQASAYLETKSELRHAKHVRKAAECLADHLSDDIGEDRFNLALCDVFASAGLEHLFVEPGEVH